MLIHIFIFIVITVFSFPSICMEIGSFTDAVLLNACATIIKPTIVRSPRAEKIPLPFMIFRPTGNTFEHKLSIFNKNDFLLIGWKDLQDLEANNFVYQKRFGNLKDPQDKRDKAVCAIIVGTRDESRLMKLKKDFLEDPKKLKTQKKVRFANI